MQSDDQVYGYVGCGRCSSVLQINMERERAKGIDFVKAVCSSCGGINQISLISLEQEMMQS